MGNGRIILARLLLLLVIIVGRVQVNLYADTTQELFPVPETLKENVRFWTEIYSRFSTWDQVIHDSYNLEIIYEVVDTRKIPRAQGYGSINQEINSIKNNYIKILEKLAISDIEDINQLEEIERRVVRIWGGLQDRKKFKLAAERVRSQTGQRDRFLKGLKTSGAYIDEMRAIFDHYELPIELTVLPLVESAFNIRAYSRLGAAGLWQFTQYTGKLFLNISYEVDERLDPIKSTDAAARLLKLNFSQLGTWPLAITAYNHGLAGMKRARELVGTTDFDIIATQYKSPSFKFASRNFYTEFLAAKHVYENHRRYFGDIEFDYPFRSEKIVLPDHVKLTTLMEQYNLDLNTVVQHNPGLRPPVLKDDHYVPRGYEFRLPVKQGVDVFAEYQRIPSWKKHDKQRRTKYYRVKKSDSLEKIAQKMDTTIDALMAMNDLGQPGRIYVGQILKIPEKSETYDRLAGVSKTSDEKSVLLASLPTSPVQVKMTGATAEVKAQDRVVDSLVVELNPQLPPENNVRTEFIGPLPLERINENLAMAGQKSPADTTTQSSLSFFNLEKPVHNTTVVQPEETLGHFAAWLKIPTQKLRDVNHLPFGRDINFGQRIRLIFENVSEDDFHQQRLEYHKGLQEDFFSSYQIESLQTHVVAEGENIWEICTTRYEIPLWLVMRYNPKLNMFNLHGGDQLIIPVVVER